MAKRAVAILLLLILVVTSFVSVYAQESQRYLNNRLDITILDEITSEQDYVDVLLESTEPAVLREQLNLRSESRILRNRYISTKVKTDQLARFLQDERIVKIHPNRRYQFSLSDSIALSTIEESWDNGITGKGVLIAILDTGIAQHPMLDAKVVAQEAFITNSYVDDNGHGTHVAAIALGDDESLTGVAPDAFLLSAKVLDDSGEGTTTSIAEGIYWAVEQGADIISMSFGAAYHTQDVIINDAIDYAIEQEVIVVVASGNCAEYATCNGFNDVTIPGSYENVITVGAVTKNIEWASFSSGTYYNGYIKPDLVAPGVDIISAGIDGGYTTKSGTSMATPYVSGMIALLLEENPDLQHYDVKLFLENNAVDLGDEGKDPKFGSGFYGLVSEVEESVEPSEVIEIGSIPKSEEIQTNDVVSGDELVAENEYSTAGVCNVNEGYLCGVTCHSSCPDPSKVLNCDMYKPTCCPQEYPYFSTKWGQCMPSPEFYGCTEEFPHDCPNKPFCFSNNVGCSNLKYCGGKWSYCLNPVAKFNCVEGEPKCCPPSKPFFWVSDNECHNSPEPNENECGNNECEFYETKESCPNDCVTNIKITEIETNGFPVVSGNQKSVTVELKNIGDEDESARVDVWLVSTEYDEELDHLCSDNSFSQDKKVSVDAGETKDYTFKVTAPGANTVDACTDEEVWGDFFEIIAMTYDKKCGDEKCTINQVETKEIVVVNQCSSHQECKDEFGDEYKCLLDGDPSTCFIPECEDTCSNYNQYSCSYNNNVQKCKMQYDGCYDNEEVDICYGDYTCESGSSSCKKINVDAELYLEDAGQGKKIFKRPGDIVKVKIDHKVDEEIILDFDSSIFSGDCPTTTYLTSDIECTLTIYDFVDPVQPTIRIKGSNSEKLEIVNQPHTIIVTSKERLYERFSGQDNNVKFLIRKAYSVAEDNKGIVYDLDAYFPNLDLGSYASYDAVTTKYNDEALAIAEFVQERCSNCKDIILLGDDFVIPHYRADYADVGLIYTETNYIFTDQPYIVSKKLNMGDIETLFDVDEYDEITFVVPDNPSSELQTKIDDLEYTLEEIYGYTGIFTIDIYESHEVDCDSHWKLGDANLILIGNRENNNAIKCVPWFDVGKTNSDTFDASIEIERNVWGDNKYAVVVSGDDLVKGAANLNQILENPFLVTQSQLANKNTVYIHQLSSPPELPFTVLDGFEHVGGFVLGTCNVGGSAERVTCSATDFSLSLIPPFDMITDVRDMAIYCPIYGYKKLTGDEETLFDGIICSISGGGTAITLGKYASAPTIVGPVAGQAADAVSTAFKRIMKTAKQVLKKSATEFYQYMDALKLYKFDQLAKYLGISDWKNLDLLIKGSSDMSKVIANHKLSIKFILNEFDPQTMSSVLNSLDKLNYAAKGTEFLYKTQDFSTYLKETPNWYRLKLVTELGKHSDEIVSKGWKPYTGGKFVFRGSGYFFDSPDLVFDFGFIAKNTNMRDLQKHALEGVDGTFISASKDKEIAAYFAKAEGWVYEINPRGLNGIDVEKTLEIEHFAGGISDKNWWQILEEKEVVFLNLVFKEDIKGAWKVGADGKIIEDSYIKNKNYID